MKNSPPGVSSTGARPPDRPLRPPAVPLVACDPYFSIWSQADRLHDVDTTHWTGKPHRLASTVTIDGQQYRVMGGSTVPGAPLPQKHLTVLPTRTIYGFEGAGVDLTLTFMTPALPDDVDVLSRPVTYLSYELRSADGQTHQVQVSFAASAELAVDTPDQQVVWSREAVGGLVVLRIGSTEQSILGKAGDDVRIDWGYLYIAAEARELSSATIAEAGAAGGGAAAPEPRAPAAAGGIAGSLVFRADTVAGAPVSHRLVLAYDDLYSIQYLGENLRPYWRRTGWEAADLLTASAEEYEALADRCASLDQQLMADLEAAGGVRYARICALAFRHCFAAGKFVVDGKGRLLSFCKENHSNGCIATSDVFYPMSPQFLLFGPVLAKSFLTPFMDYAASGRWRFPFAPHDLGTYPHANGQRYGGGESDEENQMPVEESANLLLLFGALAEIEGNADFAGRYWTQLSQWAEYLRARGFDPEHQLCTDDFAGHLAHNVNLSAKAICGLGAYAKLCRRRGDQAKADEFARLARDFAARWIREADDGDHFRLAYDRANTWSQKYNLVWDRVLGLALFPEAVARKEMAYYRKIQGRYGLPLDHRKSYTKLDWILWTATLTQDRADFEAMVDPVYRFIDETPDRTPLTDWYDTDSGQRVGFTARPVIGGAFMQMLRDRKAWMKYAGRRAAG